MTGRAGVGPLFDFDAFRAAVGLAVVCGALSTFVPLFVAPTATLAALALAGWVSLSRRRGSLSLSGLGSGSAVALGVLGGATLGFLEPPWFLAPVRGLVLAGGLLPLFASERLRSSPRLPVYSRA